MRLEKLRTSARQLVDSIEACEREFVVQDAQKKPSLLHICTLSVLAALSIRCAYFNSPRDEPSK